MRHRKISIIAMLFYFWLYSVSFAKDNLLLAQLYWSDSQKNTSFAEVQRATFAEFEGAIAQGYSANALWIKLSISAFADASELAIIIQPAFVRRIELYDPSIRGIGAQPVLSGRDAPLTADNHVGIESGFIIPSTPFNRNVYLRLTSTTSLVADVSVIPAKTAIKNSFIQGSLVAVYIAFLLSFSVWGLMAWAIRRDALFGLFALRQLFSSAHIFVYFGSLRFSLAGVFDAQILDGVYVFVCCTVASVTGLFDLRLISELGGARRLRQAIHIVLLFPILSLPLAAMGYGQTALQASALVINLQMLMLTALAFTLKGDKAKPLGAASIALVRFGYIVMTTVVVVPLLMYLNVLETSVPVFKMVFLHAIISTIILFGLLLMRNRQRDLAEQEARLLLSVKEAELLKESGRRMEKESFLSMLTHELRNPLSVIQLLSNSDKATDRTLRQAATDMADVIARVEQSERIDSGGIHVERSQFDLSAMVAQVVQSHRERRRVFFDDPGPHMVASDPGLMVHVLENLLDNALKYSANDTKIRIAVSAEHANGQPGVVVRVSNLVGDAGLPDPDRVFTKYYRSKRAYRKPGSGLGLFLVARWVAALGGTVDFSVFGEVKGLQTVTFSFWVPR